MLYQKKNKDIDDDEVEIPSMVQKKTDQWPASNEK